jgi:hypothetical protein
MRSLNAQFCPHPMFSESDVDNIVDILNRVRANAAPTEGAA